MTAGVVDLAELLEDTLGFSCIEASACIDNIESKKNLAFSWSLRLVPGMKIAPSVYFTLLSEFDRITLPRSARHLNRSSTSSTHHEIKQDLPHSKWISFNARRHLWLNSVVEFEAALDGS